MKGNPLFLRQCFLKAQQCGWLKDKYGLSWQIAPDTLAEMICDPDTRKTASYMDAMMKMKKLDIKALRHAFENPQAKNAA